MTKVKLLNSGGYDGLEGLDYDTEFTGIEYHGEKLLGYDVPVAELIDAGAVFEDGYQDIEIRDSVDVLYFSLGFGIAPEVEVVSG